MEIVIAVILFGVLATYVPHFVMKFAGKFIPSQILAFPFWPVILVGASVVLGMWVMRKAGAGGIVREATSA